MIRIESREAFNRRLAAAAKAGQSKPRGFSFESYEQMQRLLTANRMAILKALMRDSPMGVRDIGRAVGKDSGNVSRDLKALSDAGLVEKDQAGLYRVEFERMRFDFSIEAAA